MSGSAVAAGDVRSTCGNCGSALVVERGGVVRLAEPPPGPAAAQQLIVPPTFEPPSHATAMREFAMADEATTPDAAPTDFNALLGADVRAYVDEGQEPGPSFSGPARFGSDDDTAITERTPALPTPEMVPVITQAPISVPFELPVTAVSPALAPQEPPFSASDAPYAVDAPAETVDAPAGETYAAPEQLESYTAEEAFGAPEQVAETVAAPQYDAQPHDAQPYDAQPHDAQPYDAQPYDAQPHDAQPQPEQTYDQQAYMATSTPTYEPPAYEPPAYEAPVYETPAYQAPVYDASAYARGPDGEARPPALMFPQSHVGGMTGPARESEPPQLASVIRPVERPAVAPQFIEPQTLVDTQPFSDPRSFADAHSFSESDPGSESAPIAEPVLLTDTSDTPEVLGLESAMPEWSGESLDEAAPYVPPFSNPVSEDEIESGVTDGQRRAAYPTPDSYFDASDPLATAEADMYAGHEVVAPTEMVGDAFTAMVPPVGTYVPHDSPTIDLTPDTATRLAAEEAEDRAVLRAGRRKRAIWATAICFVFAVGAASYAASRGYLDGVIGRVNAGLGKEEKLAETVAVDTEVQKAEAPKPAPVAENREPSAENRVPPTENREPGAENRVPPTENREPGAENRVPSAENREPGAENRVPSAENREPPSPTPAPTEDPVAPAKGPPSKALNACYTKGNRLLNAKKVNLAIRELNKCLDIDPTYGRTYRSLGVAYMLLGRERSAILAYEKFVDYDPQHKDVAKVREIIADYYRRRKN